MNYTRPNDPDHEDTPNDWLSGALIFGRALSMMLRESEGIVVDIKGDAKLATYPDCKKAIVYYENSQINIVPCEEDLEEGQLVWMSEDGEEDDGIDFDINLN